LTITEFVESTHFAHSQKVSEISRILAQNLGYSPEDVNIIEQAALFHDIGKTAIEPALLNKPGALTQQEFDIVKTHTAIGCERISEIIRILSAAKIVAADHHEQLAGGGYKGLCGDAVHPFARIVGVADVYDALVSRRSYKPAFDVKTTCEYMQGRAGIHFDAQIIAVLLRHIDEIMALYVKEEMKINA